MYILIPRTHTLKLHGEMFSKNARDRKVKTVQINLKKARKGKTQKLEIDKEKTNNKNCSHKILNINGLNMLIKRLLEQLFCGAGI
jgi:hypothetical protein